MWQSKVQKTVALSSCEAEYYAMSKGAAAACGLQGTFRDWKPGCKIELYCDSSSARPFAQRRGLGKNRHIETRFLWLQERVASKHLKVLKVRTDASPADLFTKALAANARNKYCEELGQEFRH